jgi:hypothetical protein
VATAFSITTVSEYTVIGYGGVGGRGWTWLVGAGTGLLLLLQRRKVAHGLRRGMTVALLGLVLAGASMGLIGCSGKLPARNASYTPAGSFTVTVSATDGFLVHTATYSLTVTAP